MKKNIYSFLSGAKQILLALAITLFSGMAYSQVSYTLSYTGSVQTLTLLPGTYSINSWGGDGYTQTAGYNGKGGFASGILTLPSTQTVYIYVGGLGTYPAGGVSANVWTFNGGGVGYPAANAAYGNGGGASDVRTVGGLWDNLASLSSRVIVAGGGGAGRNSSYIGGNGGGLTGGTGTYFSPDQTGGPTGGTQIGGGSNTGYTSGLTVATLGKAMTWDGSSLTANFLAGGGGGFYGGASGRVAGGGGSSYLGGVSSGTTIMYGQPGFVSNPDISGNGRVQINELCSVRIFASGTNSINPAICSGNSLTLTTTAVSNFTWSTGNTTNTTIVVSPTSNQSYSIVGTSTANCQSSGVINVIVNSGIPILSITNSPNNICLGKTATITAAGAVSYTWTGSTPTPTNGVSFLPGAGVNTYTVTGQNGCGTSNAVTTLTVAPLAVSIVASSNSVCAGSTTTLTASSAVTGYTWQPGPVIGSTAIYGPIANTVYTVTASDGTCSGVASISVSAIPIPTLSIVSSATAVCQGAAVTMTASGAVNYSWSPGTQTGPTYSDNPTGPTLYVVTGTNTLGCSASSSTFVLTFASPTVAISANKTLVCAGDQVILAASGATSYVWSGGPSTAGYTVNPLISTNYVVTGSDNGCTGTKTISINVLTASVAIASSTTSICNGGSVNLSASGANTYTWTGSQLSGFGASVTATPSTTSIYTISATTTTVSAPTLKCPSFANITITVFNNPTVSISATKTLVCKQDASVTLTGSGASTYSWSNNASTSTISVHPQSNTTYTITGMDNNGCSSTGSLEVKVNACTGINSINAVASSLSVYPNPNNGTFMLKADAAMDLNIVNELGQRVMSLKLQESTNYSLEIKDLKPGIYFIVNEKGSAAVKKIVVN